MHRVIDMTIQTLEKSFSICKLPAAFEKSEGKNCKFLFAACADGEYSLLCPSECVPENALERSDGWRAFRIAPPVKLDMVGLLSDISRILARAEVSVMPVGTFDTVYFFLRSDGYLKALGALGENGYKVEMAYL